MAAAGLETDAAVRHGLVKSMATGFLGRCPHCGKGKIFGRFLKVRPDCESCGLEMHHHRADDLPPYIVIFIVGHIVGYFAARNWRRSTTCRCGFSSPSGPSSPSSWRWPCCSR